MKLNDYTNGLFSDLVFDNNIIRFQHNIIFRGRNLKVPMALTFDELKSISTYEKVVEYIEKGLF
jgi:hypothetical protein